MSDFACRICRSTDVRRVLSLGEQPHCNSFLTAEQLDEPEPFYPLETWLCADCSLLQLKDTVARETMFLEHPYVSGTTTTLTTHFAQLAGRVAERKALGPDSLVVDIGSNDGTWLKAFRDLGTRTLGVEPAARIAALAQDAGIETEVDFWGADVARGLADKHGKASVITAAGVFFHIDDVHDFVGGVDAMLADDGVFVIQAMYLRDIVERTAFDSIYHEHVEYYSLRPLTVLFEQFGMEVVDVERVDIHGGSFIVSVQRKGTATPSPAVAAMLADEEAAGLYEQATYERFAERTAEIRDRVVELLRGLKAEGRTIAAYGAPARGNTLLNYAKIGPDLLDFAAEKNPLKFGLHTPGMHIPVIDEAEAPRPDAYLLLAWNFGPELLAKEQAFRDAGGQFVVPLPEPRVI